jgi:hypothetical protein
MDLHRTWSSETNFALNLSKRPQWLLCYTELHSSYIQFPINGSAYQYLWTTPSTYDWLINCTTHTWNSFDVENELTGAESFFRNWLSPTRTRNSPPFTKTPRLVIELTLPSAGPPSQPDESTADNIYYIPLNTTLFPAGGSCCLERHVSAHVCHLQVRF